MLGHCLQVRAPDGLVQRYMHRIKLPLKVYWHGSHGHMEESHQEFADRLFRRTRFNAISFRIDHPAEDDSDEFFDGADTTAAGSNSARATGFPEDYFKKSSVFVSELAERCDMAMYQDYAEFCKTLGRSNRPTECTCVLQFCWMALGTMKQLFRTILMIGLPDPMKIRKATTPRIKIATLKPRCRLS